MRNKLGSVLSVCFYTGGGGRQEEKKRIKTVKVSVLSVEAILVHTVSGKYGGSYSIRKDRNALRRHCNINWKPCGPVEKTAQQLPGQRSTLTRVRWDSLKKKENGSPELAITVHGPGGNQKGVIVSIFLASVIEFLRV